MEIWVICQIQYFTSIRYPKNFINLLHQIYLPHNNLYYWQKQKMYSENEKQKSFGQIQKVQGSMIVAEGMSGAKNHQIVMIGSSKMLGEIVKLQKDSAFIQPFQSSHGLQAGDLVHKTGKPLSAELGPGILGSLCDGIQRNIVSQQSGLVYLSKNLGLPALDAQKKWTFTPRNFKQGSLINHGDCFGSVQEKHLQHQILLPPKNKGRITYIAPEGDYNIHEQVLELELNGVRKKYSMSHRWPIRQPRPFEEKLQLSEPLHTGYRILDGLFPMALGGTCAMNGGFTSRNALVAQNISVNTRSDVIVYVGCNQKGTEIGEVIDNFAWLSTNNKKQKMPLLNKTSILGNASNMSVISRQASIYTAATIAQYYRDMGLNTLLISDSISKWTQTFKERSLLLSQMPGDANFQSHLRSRLNHFFQRAGKVTCLGSPNRNGSLSIISTINSGKFSDLVTTPILDSVKCFWYIDQKLAQIKHFPEISWRQSNSFYQKQLDSFYVSYDPDFLKASNKAKHILGLCQDMYQKYGQIDKEKLTQQEKLIIETAKLLKTEFLQQNVFSAYDYTCPLEKTSGLIKSIITYYNLANQILESASPTKKSYGNISTGCKMVLKKLYQAKFYEPNQSKQNTVKYFEDLQKQIESSLQTLSQQ